MIRIPITNLKCVICGHKIQKNLLPNHGPYDLQGVPYVGKGSRQAYACHHCWSQECILLPDKSIPRKYRVLYKEQIVNYTLDEVGQKEIVRSQGEGNGTRER